MENGIEPQHLVNTTQKLRWPNQAVVFLLHRNSTRLYRHFARLRHELRHSMPVFLCLHRPSPDLPYPSFQPDFVVSVEDGAAVLPTRHAQMQKGDTGYFSFNDLAYMPALFGAELAQFEHLWVIEYDVDFSGDWKTFFEWAAASRADLIGFDFILRSHSLQWMHWKRFAAPERVAPETAMCALFCLARFSRRFLQLYQTELRDPTWQGITEALYPTIASHHELSIANIGSLEVRPKVRSIADETSLPADFIHKSWFDSHPVQGTQYFHEAPEKFPFPNRLVHPIKINEREVVTARGKESPVSTTRSQRQPAPAVAETEEVEVTRQAITLAVSSQQASFVQGRLRISTFCSSRWPYLYVDTPKCASTTTKKILWDLEGFGPQPPDIHDRKYDRGRLSALSVGRDDALKLLFGAEVVRFRVARDPLKRLVSAYRDKVLQFPAVFAKHRDEITKYFGLPDERHISFDHFAEYVCATPDQDRDVHWMSQRLLTLSDAISYTIVVRQEHYAEDMATVFDFVGIPRKAWPSFDGADTPPPQGFAVSKATARLVEAAYSTDYELFERTTGEVRVSARWETPTGQIWVKPPAQLSPSTPRPESDPPRPSESALTLAALALALREDVAGMEAQPLDAGEISRCHALIEALARGGRPPG